MATERVLTERKEDILTVTINRAEARNAVDRPTAAALREAFKAFDADDSLSVAVLTGAGGNFCAGADLKAIGDLERGNEVEATGTGEGPMGPTQMPLSKPVIAGISGYAVAGGLELALWCDLRVVDETAIFGVFCRRWGVPLIDGGTVRLPRVVGQGRAMDMILTGRPVGAEEAMVMGLANRIAPKGHALDVAQTLARDIAAFPQQCLRADRSSAISQWDLPTAEALVAEGAGGYPVIAAEAVSGAARFAAGAGRHGQSADGVNPKGTAD